MILAILEKISSHIKERETERDISESGSIRFI
jgi:hypothetical protein